MRENLAATLRLLLVTDDALLAGRDIVALCRDAVAGGVTSVQLRLKKVGDRELLEMARALVASLRVPVLVNDRIDIALAAGAAGVHLGGDDLPPAQARRIAPPDFIVGASVGNAGEITRGQAADYWGIGPLRRTDTKGDAGDELGLSGAGRILHAASGRPCILIGGVLPADVPLAHQSGFAGVAVARGILGAADVAAAARNYLGAG